MRIRNRIYKIAVALLLCCAMLMQSGMMSFKAEAATKVGKAKIAKITTASDNPKIAWEAVSGATGYRVYRKTASDKKFVKVGSTAKLNLTDKKWKADEGSVISYKVRAYVKKDGKTTWGAYSDAVEWTVPGTAADYPAPKYGKLKVTGHSITDSKGKVVQLQGVSTHGLQWFPEFVTYDAFKTMRDDWNVNTVRLAMYTEEEGYCTVDNAGKEKFNKLIDQAVDDCRKLGMYAIIDWHVHGEGNPNLHKAEAKKFFDRMSKKYADCDNVLYELCNEPNGDNLTWLDDVKPYAEEIIPVIRKNDPDAIIIVGTPMWDQMIIDAAENRITGYDNIMYTLHFYSGTHGEWLLNDMEVAVTEYDLPVFVTEFGPCECVMNGRMALEEADKWMKVIDKYKISNMIWALSNKDEPCALIDKNCKKLSGWTYDDLSAEGKWYVKRMGGYKGK